MTQANYLEVGKILNTHGVRGELKIQPWLDAPQLFQALPQLFVNGKSYTVQSVRMQGANVLVLDEPTVGLDPKQITEIRSLIRRLGREKTILFSSHILSEVQQLCDHVVILHQGQVKTAMALDETDSTDAVSLLATVGAAEKSIVPRLRELDGLRRLTVQPDSHPDRTTLTLVFAAGQGEPERRLFALLSRLGVPLLHLSRQSGDLEQVFLQAIADE